MEAKEATGTQSRTERADFQATADPALNEAADRTADIKLLDYEELYALWERQQWQTQELDFSQDSEDWAGFPEEERFQRMYGLSSFFIGEQKVAEELGPIMRAAPTEDQKIFLCTQIADEARHVRFFERFYREVGVLEADGLSRDARRRPPSTSTTTSAVLFDEMLKQRTDRLSAEPEDTEALVEAVTLYHMVIEGMLALTGQHFIMDFNEREGTLPGFVEGFQNVARDEHRHVAFGSVFLREKAHEDDRYKQAIQRTLEESVPAAEGVLSPPWAPEDEDYELFGFSIADTRAFAAKCLMRRLKVIGLG